MFFLRLKVRQVDGANTLQGATLSCPRYKFYFDFNRPEYFFVFANDPNSPLFSRASETRIKYTDFSLVKSLARHAANKTFFFRKWAKPIRSQPDYLYFSYRFRIRAAHENIRAHEALRRELNEQRLRLAGFKDTFDLDRQQVPNAGEGLFCLVARAFMAYSVKVTDFRK